MFNIPTRESTVVWRLFAFSLTIAISYIVSRTVGDSLFLSRVGNDQLALVFVFAGCCTAAAAGGWYFATRRLSISKTIQISGITFATLNVTAWYLLPHLHHSFWLLAAIYLLAEIKGCINVINIVSALNSKLGRDASKPAWAAIGLAAPIAAVFGGGMFAFEYHLLSLRDWLLIGAVLDVASCLCGVLIGKSAAVGVTASRLIEHGRRLDERKLAPRSRSYVCPKKFRFWIGILISTKIIVLTIVAFEWKSTVNTFFDSNPVNLMRFFGSYYGIIGVATIVIQLLVTSPLLVRRNLSLPILLMPLVLVGVAFSFAVGIGLFAALLATTVGKSVEVWRRSVHDTTLNLLYTRIPRGERRSTISLNNGFIKPVAEVIASSVIFLGAAAVYRPLFLIALVIWILAAVRLIRLVNLSRTAKKTEDPPDSDALTEQEHRFWRSNPT
jgi:ATP/ADP translocase